MILAIFRIIILFQLILNPFTQFRLFTDIAHANNDYYDEEKSRDELNGEESKEDGKGQGFVEGFNITCDQKQFPHKVDAEGKKTDELTDEGKTLHNDCLLNKVMAVTGVGLFVANLIWTIRSSMKANAQDTCPSPSAAIQFVASSQAAISDFVIMLIQMIGTKEVILAKEKNAAIKDLGFDEEAKGALSESEKEEWKQKTQATFIKKQLAQEDLTRKTLIATAASSFLEMALLFTSVTVAIYEMSTTLGTGAEIPCPFVPKSAHPIDIFPLKNSSPIGPNRQLATSQEATGGKGQPATEENVQPERAQQSSSENVDFSSEPLSGKEKIADRLPLDSNATNARLNQKNPTAALAVSQQPKMDQFAVRPKVTKDTKDTQVARTVKDDKQKAPLNRLQSSSLELNGEARVGSNVGGAIAIRPRASSVTTDATTKLAETTGGPQLAQTVRTAVGDSSAVVAARIGSAPEAKAPVVAAAAVALGVVRNDATTSGASAPSRTTGTTTNLAETKVGVQQSQTVLTDSATSVVNSSAVDVVRGGSAPEVKASVVAASAVAIVSNNATTSGARATEATTNLAERTGDPQLAQTVRTNSGVAVGNSSAVVASNNRSEPETKPPVLADPAVVRTDGVASGAIIHADTTADTTKSAEKAGSPQELQELQAHQPVDTVESATRDIATSVARTEPESKIAPVAGAIAEVTAHVSSRHLKMSEAETADFVKMVNDDVGGKHFPLTKEMLTAKNGEFRPTKKIIIGDKEVYLSEVFNDGDPKSRDYAVMYTKNESGQFVPRFLYKSLSDGNWRSCPDIEFAGGKVKRLSKGRGFHYTQETKPVREIISALEEQDAHVLAKADVEEFEKFFASDEISSTHRGGDAGPTTEVSNRNINNFNSVSNAYDDKGVLAQFQDLPPSQYGRNSRISNSVNIVDGFTNFKFDTPALQKFKPNFSTDQVKQEYKMTHTLLSKKTVDGKIPQDITVRVFEGELEGRAVEWHMANDSDGRIWIERINFKDSRINSYGTYSEVIDSGALTNKPIEYWEQSYNLPKEFCPIFASPYADISKLLNELPPIKEYRANFNIEYKVKTTKLGDNMDQVIREDQPTPRSSNFYPQHEREQFLQILRPLQKLSHIDFFTQFFQKLREWPLISEALAFDYSKAIQMASAGLLINGAIEPQGEIAKYFQAAGVAISAISVLLIFLGLVAEVKKWGSSAKIVDKDYIMFARERAISGMVEGSLTSIIAAMTVLQIKNVDKRIDILEKHKTDWESLENSFFEIPIPHLEKNIFLLLKELMQKVGQVQVVAKSWANDQSQKEPADLKNDFVIESSSNLKSCMNRKRELDILCRCQSSNTCYQLKIENLPQGLRKVEHIQKIFQVANQLYSGQIALEDLKIDEMQQLAFKTRNLATKVQEKSRQMNKGKGKTIPSLNEVIQQHIGPMAKSLPTSTQEQYKQFLVATSPMALSELVVGGNSLSQSPSQSQSQRRNVASRDQNEYSMSKVHNGSVEQSVILKPSAEERQKQNDDFSETENAILPNKNYSYIHPKNDSIWKVISRTVQKILLY